MSEIKKIRIFASSEIVRHISWQIISTVIVVVCGFIQSIILAKFLGLNQFGILALVIGLATVSAQLLDLRYTDILVKYLTAYCEEGCYDKSFGIITNSILISSLFFIVGYIFFFIVWDFFQSIYFGYESTDVHLVFVFCLANVFINTQFNYIFQSVFRVHNLIGKLSLINVMLSFSRVLALFIGLCYFQFTLIDVVVVLFIVNTVFLTLFATIAFRFLIKKAGSIHIVSSIMTFKFESGMKRFIRSTYLTSIFSIPSKELDINILGFYSTPEMVGLYRMAKNFLGAIWAFVDQVVLLVYADFSRKYKKGNLFTIKKAIRGISYFSTVFVAFTWTIAYFYLDRLVLMVLDESYIKSVELFLIMFAGAFIWGGMIWAAPVALTLNKPQLIFKTNLVVSVLLVFIYFIFSYYWGVIGSAIAYSLSPILVSIVLTIWLTKENEFMKILKC